MSLPRICTICTGTEAASLEFAAELVRNRLAADASAQVDIGVPALMPVLRQRRLAAGRAFGDAAAPGTVVLSRPATKDPVERLELTGSGAPSPQAGDLVVALRPVAPPSREVLLVSGEGGARLTEGARARVRLAGRLSRTRPYVAVILSGWDGWGAAESEAAHMLRAWDGPADAPLVLDPAARTTAENALCAVALCRALPVDRITAVVPWSNALRAGLHLILAARGTRIGVRVRPCFGPGQGSGLRAGLVGLAFLRRHQRAGRALLELGPDAAAARP